MNFRLLKPDEIDCRIATISDKGASILLYKDARVDQNILDETVGPMNWQRHHSRENANCTVAIWDEIKEQWIEKEDTGKESFTEAEKGLASDSFKRACFNWGIGRELYTAPFIWLGPGEVNLEKNEKGKWYTRDSFEVSNIDYDANRNIKYLVIRNRKTHKVVFTTGEKKSNPEPVNPEPVKETPTEPSEQDMANVAKQQISSTKVAALRSACKNRGIPEDKILKLYKVESLEALNERQYSNINEHWEQIQKS